MRKKYDIVIVGGGAMGLATAAQLSNTNKKVLLLEQFGFLNQKGSSAGMSRQFRVQYAQKYMAQLALDSIPFWEELQSHTEDSLIDKVGSLWFGSPDISSQEGGIQAAMEVMDELNIPYKKLDAASIEKNYPFKNLPKDYSGFFQPDGGIIDMRATLQTLFNIANDASNIDLEEYVTLTDVESRRQGDILLTTDKGHTIKTEKLILTEGAYVNDTLALLGLHINLDIWEMSSAYYKRTEAVQLPTWFVFQEPQNTSLFYGFPEVEWANPGYIRVAPDIPDRIIHSPDERSFIPSETSLKLNTDWVREHMVGLEPEAEFTSTCIIALSNNGKELMLDTAPEWVHNHENILVYTGGWAAKFIPLLGKILADLALEGTTSYDISHFAIDWPLVRGEISKRFQTGIQENLQLDVAVVGAGASGLYSGYRLLHGNTRKGKSLNLDVNIFECSDRVGGRLESVKLPGMNVVGELGGMRYMTQQQIVTALIEDVFAGQYGLKPIGFPMGDANHHLFYLRKQRFFANRFSQAHITGESFQTRYFVEEKFQGKSSDTIFTDIIREVLEADGYSLEKIQKSKSPRKEWNKVKQKLRYQFEGPYHKKPVYEIGFWNLLKDRSSQECYEFLAQAGGYYSNTINWNAAEAFPYMVGDFASDQVMYKTIEGGYDQVLTCLADAFLQKGGTIRTKNRLESFKRNPDSSSSYRYILTFFNSEANKSWEVQAKDLILGMPRRSLELLDQDNFFFDRDTQEELHKQLDSVIIEPSYKILLGFEEPWWEKVLGAKAGESITDLPMRQCYYFGVDPKNSHSLFLASYNDMRTVSFWQALEGGKPFKTRKTKLIRGGNVLYPHYEHASEMMVEEVMSQVRELHGPSITIPDPYTSAYKDWTEDPFGGGYHAWKGGYEVWEVMPYMRQPYQEERIFIVGEAYSDQQGWVEGAFCVTEHVMREKYDLVCPDWLSKSYYLGW
ncbi:MAG: FAD-dependent oxidoreductase [Bacteroidota bacterium]